VLASTEAEFDALAEARVNDWRFAELLDLFFDLQRKEADDDLDVRRREKAHFDRLASAQRISNLRVGD
jgi:hypothetical protein